MQTFGDKLDQFFTILIKLFNNHENFYHPERLRAMSKEELLSMLEKESDLNLQRNKLIDEINKTLADIVSGKEKTIEFKKHKTA